MHPVEGSSAHASSARPGTGAERGAARGELHDLARGAAGGFLFGIPLLYTMELWFKGLSISAFHAVLLVALSLALALAFVLVIGFRGEERPGPLGFVAEAIDAVGIAILVAALTLLVLGRIAPDDDLDVIAGLIAIQLVPVTLGVSIANHLLPRAGGRVTGEDDRDAERRINPTLLDLFAAAAGALLLSLNIAPTDEVRMVAGELGEPRLVVLVVFSLLVSYLVVFEAELGNQHQRRQTEGVLQRPLTETVASYVVALLVCALVTWLVGGFPDDPSPGAVLAQVVVLGLPGALGAAAGRLAV
jgi:putative integral membrane protein (TIGR02587 family)